MTEARNDNEDVDLPPPITEPSSHTMHHKPSDFDEAGRLQSLGLMAGVVAHDFNNLLVGVLGHAELGLMKIKMGDDPTAHFNEIKVTAERAADLIKELLASGSDDEFPKKVVSPVELIGDTVRLVAVRIPENVELSRTFEMRVPAINANATQIRQALMNLVLNAVEAIGKRNGSVQISATVQSPGVCLTENPPVYLGAALQDKAYVCLEVRDTGDGMSAETLAHAFSLFYTTKKTGTGLGLASVEKVIREHRGALELSSDVGKGTCARIYLPPAE